MCEISVIIPVYNAEKYLGRAVDSILAQIYKDLELILVDDGSTDDSGKICEDYAQQDCRIKVLHLKNGGPAKARRIGLSEAAGKYIMFADADDYLARDALQILASRIEDFDIVCSGYIRVDDNGKEKAGIIPDGQMDIADLPAMLNAFFEERNLNGSMCGKLFRKELFSGVDFCEQAIIGEDINLMLQLYEKSTKIRCLPDVLYFYYINQTGISHSGYTGKHKAGLYAYINARKRWEWKYPNYKAAITAFFLEYEMAVITAMARSHEYDQETIDLLKMELKENIWDLIGNKYTALLFKFSAVSILINDRLFVFMFQRLRGFFGR